MLMANDDDMIISARLDTSDINKQVDDLKKLWENRGKQYLDENEDCKAKVVKLKDVRDDLSLQAIGYVGLSILERYFTNEWF
jgi:hypothetical protein